MLRRLRIENLVLIREADLVFAPGLSAITGETGAGKTILAQAIGLLLGTRGDAAAVGAAGVEAYVEAELDVPDGFFEEDELAALAELRPEDEPGLPRAPPRRPAAPTPGAAVPRGSCGGRRAADRDVGTVRAARRAPGVPADVLDAFCANGYAGGSAACVAPAVQAARAATTSRPRRGGGRRGW